MSTRHQYTTVLVRKTLHRSFKAVVKSRKQTIVEVVASLLSGYIQQSPHSDLAEEAQPLEMALAAAQDLGQYENAANDQASRVTPATRRG
jgi:cytochrome P450